MIRRLVTRLQGDVGRVTSNAAVLSLAVGVLVACVTAPVRGRPQLMMLPRSQDEQLGRQAFAQLIAAYGK